MLDGRYRLHRRLGSGSSATVFEARPVGLARESYGAAPVAIKVLRQLNAADVERFTHEAFVGSRVTHRGLLRTIDFGRLRDGRMYAVFPRCTGTTLSSLLRQRGPLDGELTVRILTEVASALTALHEMGIAHCDVKPANIHLRLRKGKRPVVHLLDLGISTVFEPKRARRHGVRSMGSQGTYGTPAYLAPEQALGAPADHRTDVYALACVAFRMLTGQDVFRAGTVVDTLRAHLLLEPPAATSIRPDLPAAVDAVLAQGLAKDRDDRHLSAGDFVTDLARALGRRASTRKAIRA